MCVLPPAQKAPPTPRRRPMTSEACLLLPARPLLLQWPAFAPVHWEYRCQQQWLGLPVFRAQWSCQCRCAPVASNGHQLVHHASHAMGRDPYNARVARVQAASRRHAVRAMGRGRADSIQVVLLAKASARWIEENATVAVGREHDHVSPARVVGCPCAPNAQSSRLNTEAGHGSPRRPQV